MDGKLISLIVSVIIGFIVIFFLVAGLAPTLLGAAANIAASGLPLATLFAANGVLLTIFMIFLFVAAIWLAWRMAKGGK